ELRNINLSLTGFQKVGIIGPTGAGKTTLMRILAGFLTPHLKDDNFTINGQNLAQLNQKKLGKIKLLIFRRIPTCLQAAS
ncbi:ATP-binding cassette domain-containing protein, partial [Lactobacillus gasseri]|uniref:ATP-binding cassette domain-containing protein n=1 Tax=Lactobacillus gasseri TaxID=1596 RepID=UPI00055582EE